MTEDFIDGDPLDPHRDFGVAEAIEAESLETATAVEAHLQRCKTAYTRVFVEGNATPDDVDFLMRDLGWFCGAHDPQWRSDPREQDRLVARREVYMRIMEYSGLDYNTLANRYLATQK